MIIGINGYIGSGKDTVGKMIQYLDAKSKEIADREIAPKLFLPDFKYPSFEEWCKPNLHTSGYDIGYSSMYDIHVNSWRIKKFAGKLKQIATLLTGIPIEKFEDQEFKKTYLGKEWSYSKPLLRDDMLQQYKYWEDVDMTVREFLQLLGTEAIRNGLHTNAWVNALFADYKQEPDYQVGTTPENLKWQEGDFPNWLITDTRFPNEAQAIKDRGGIVVRVNRPVKGIENQQTVQLHPSETSLDDWEFDYVIDNSGSLEDLKKKVKELLNNIKN